MAVEPLSQKDVEVRLQELPGWSADGDRITRTYSFGGHFPAAAMVIHIAQIQEELDHHAEVVLGYNTVSLAVNTHSVGGKVTDLDLQLARRVEAIAAGHGAR
ncbi:MULTISPECIES: 4a-hydroxytetrahydrobiopterin dehydratase [Streptomyces]|uniref:Putative pterin-4-alpha-carbinolamine dehydratase n=1 Tax=Streptomyces morookaense TaxID=1970 RepID=A0A7Y7AZC1_STRMO|nr:MULTISPECIES: 4a-hydroxytetrahydrobiopterin dehydratase [Streptomyces]MCC2276932.1 4a-hydroxytetrahydrobiopterin dehydratase [Streptomyces sp. ET3-23]NVK76130.1 4a-hydroxytetrahydrobiopterin dehydratase [Streptomyces morookaense]GHF37566.1 putative pterin-4-alpha-carbinolamine dehydratase [Streptomyces morookaense]